MPIARIIDVSAVHATEIVRRFLLHAPVGWSIDYVIGGATSERVAEAAADGVSLLLDARGGFNTPWNQREAWRDAQTLGIPAVVAHGSNAAVALATPPRLFWPVVVGGETPGDGITERSYGPGLELDARCSDGRTEQSWAVAEAAGIYAGLLDTYGNAFDARAALRSLATPEADPNGALYGTIDLALPLGPHHADPQPPVDVRVEGGVLRWLPWQGSRYVSTSVTGAAGVVSVAVGESVDVASAFGFDAHTLTLRTRYHGDVLSPPVSVAVDTGNPPAVLPVATDRSGGASVVTAAASPGCTVLYRYRTSEGADWTDAGGPALTLATRLAAEVQARQVDDRSGRTSGWSPPILVPGLPTAEGAVYLP